jgi:hypothetical protein
VLAYCNSYFITSSVEDFESQAYKLAYRRIMDLDDQKLDVAKNEGADIIVNSKKEDPAKVVRS